SYNNRGTVHHRLGQNRLAVADFTTALARNDQYAEAHANRGFAYQALKEEDNALKDFSQAITLNRDYAPAYAERAEIYRKRKQFAAAAADCTRLIELSTDRTPLHAKRAEVYRAMNRPEEAIKDFDQLIALRPKDLQARATRADLLLSQGRYAAAREDMTRILDILGAAPKAAPVWRMRGVVNWLHLKDLDAALADFEQYSRLTPKDPHPHRFVGSMLLGRRQYGPALAALQKALDLRPDYPEAVWACAQIHLWQGNPEQALKELAPLVAKLPTGLPETLIVRAGVYQAMGRAR